MPNKNIMIFMKQSCHIRITKNLKNEKLIIFLFLEFYYVCFNLVIIQEFIDKYLNFTLNTFLQPSSFIFIFIFIMVCRLDFFFTQLIYYRKVMNLFSIKLNTIKIMCNFFLKFHKLSDLFKLFI